jgi:hypothetical protein
VVDFGYDNLIGDPKRTEVVLQAMADWAKEHGYPFTYTTEATMNVARMPRLLELMEANDFRYVFMGIESADDEVLKKTAKGQNTALPADEVVRIMNSHGMVVNTGLILGFDGEDAKSADRMLAMVQKTGAFPTLILALHALPNTTLSRRMQKEGRLFGGGLDQDRDDRTDTATTGLNFVTSRPRAQVLADLVRVLETVYSPKCHYERVAKITGQLKRNTKFKPPALMALRLSKSFLKIVRTVGMDRETAPFFWKALARALATNAAAAELVLGQAVFNWNYAKQAKTYANAIREEIAYIERTGEEAYNAKRLLPRAAAAATATAAPASA